MKSESNSMVELENKRCTNPNCRKSYKVPAGEVDDGYCCFECWEIENCMDPREIKIPAFEI